MEACLRYRGGRRAVTVDWKPSVWKIFGQVVVRLAVSIAKHDTASLAATMSFYAFFSLFPLVALLIYAASVLIPTAHIGTVVSHMLQPYFPSITADDYLSPLNLGRLADIGEQVGLLSVLTLSWSATSGFIAIQQAMDVIWETEEQRSFIGRRLIGFGMLVILLILTVGSALAMGLTPLLQHTAANLAAMAPLLHLIHIVSRVVFPLSLFCGCLVFYRYLPKRNTPWLYLLPGAFVAAVALDLARALFVSYASHLPSYEVIYGSLTAVMLLVIWIYIASLLMLFGAEVAAAIERVSRDMK